MVEAGVILGGALHLGWAGFHMLFPRIFKWDQALPRLDMINRSIYPVENWCLTFFFTALGLLSLLMTQELTSDAVGRVICLGVAIFWLFRFSLQIIYFRITHPVSLVLAGSFLLTAACYTPAASKGVL